MMNQKEKMRKDLLEELDGYFMQLVYLKDLLSVEEDIHRSEDRLQSAPNFTLIVECALIERLFESEYTMWVMNNYK